MAKATYVKFDIINNTQKNSKKVGLENKDIYVFFTQEKLNKTWTIDKATGVATSNAAGKVAPLCTLADLVVAGGAIKVDASTVVDSARIYISDSSDAVSLSAAKTIAGPTAETANFYYDFVEFVLPGGTGKVNIDTTQVDQLGIPITLQVTPVDPDFSSGSGVLPTLDRQTLIADFESMATGKLAAFNDCLFKKKGDLSTIYRLLNPADVLSSELSAAMLEGALTTSGSKGNWTATFTISGPGSPIPSNGGLSIGWSVSGAFIPVGTVVHALPDAPSGTMVVMKSTAKENPFTAATTSLYFIPPMTTLLSTYFDNAIDAFFNFCKQNPKHVKVEQNRDGKDYIYTASVVELKGVPNIENGKSDYTVLQFTGGAAGKVETYNIYYPFFTTNSDATKKSPFNVAIPPPPAWWNPAYGLMFFEPPSMMVFGASGVFADNTQQSSHAPASCKPASATILGSIENVIVTALVRGHAMDWKFMEGTINNQTTKPPYTAKVTLSSPYTTKDLNDKMYMASYQISNVPMTPKIKPADKSTFHVSSPLEILATVPDLLTFAQFYPVGGTWSAFSNFLHNGAGHDIMIDGRAYALPFDDQGGFSSDLNSETSLVSPTCVTITLGPWSPVKK